MLVDNTGNDPTKMKTANGSSEPAMRYLGLTVVVVQC